MNFNKKSKPPINKEYKKKQVVIEEFKSNEESTQNDEREIKRKSDS